MLDFCCIVDEYDMWGAGEAGGAGVLEIKRAIDEAERKPYHIHARIHIEP